MIEGRDIIILSIQAWDIEIGSNCKNIALEFAKKNRVLYVNAPLDRLTLMRQKGKPSVLKRIAINKELNDDLVKLGDQMWNLYPRTVLESINQLPINSLFDFLNKRNNKLFAKQIKKAIERLGFKNYIIFNDSDMFRSLFMKELLKPAIYVYYTRDNLIAVDYWKKQGVRIEAKHMAKADLVVANSTYLADLARRYNPNSYYVGQGCDTSLFDPSLVQTIPEDLAPIKKPIIGYIGALKSLRLDLNILVHIAKTRADWNLVLVGPEDDVFKNSELHKLPNVFFLGNKDANELPAYLSGFDVALNPQILNEVTRGNYPRKIDEYLAMGKPTVATKTEAMSVFADFVSLANGMEDYLKLIEHELASDSPEKMAERMKFASEHTWENNVKKIYSRINQHSGQSNN